MTISIQLPRFKRPQTELLEREAQLESLSDAGMAALNENEFLTERLAELELAVEDQGWIRIDGMSGDNDFSRDHVRKIGYLARINYLKNPLINRGVNVQTHYVFGQGVSIRA